MKILKIFGIVAGIHVLALVLIFVNPGCSSTKAAADTGNLPPPPPAATPVPMADAPPAASPSPAQPDGAPAPVPVPADSGSNAFYSPIRPNSAAATAILQQEQPAPAAEVTPASTYKVKSGDSLWLVAHKNHIKVSELAAANHLRSTSTLRPGQKLVIPGKEASDASPMGIPATTDESATPKPAAAMGESSKSAGATKYTVKSGDKLSLIARRYGLTTGDLAAANNISDPTKIRPGQELVIPAGHTAHSHRSHVSHAAASTQSAPSAPMPEATAPAESAAPTAASSEPAAPPIIKLPSDLSGAPSTDGSAPAK